MQSVTQALKGFFVISLVAVAFSSCSKNMDESIDQNTQAATLSSIPNPANSKRSTVDVPYQKTLFVSCANGGAGEQVLINGLANFVFQILYTDNGFSMSYHMNAYGLTGVGLTTGEQFVGSGEINGTASGSWENSEFVADGPNMIRVISNNTVFYIHFQYHITVTPNGNVTVDIWETTSSCL